MTEAIRFSELVGKRIVAFRGIANKVTELEFILFDDGETFIYFSKQDEYDYHDCSLSARQIEVFKDKVQWKKMLDCDTYKEPGHLGSYPF